VRLVDFQIYARGGPSYRDTNGALFVVGEPIRLWIKSRKIEAPFRKLLVDISDSLPSREAHGRTVNCLGICGVLLCVDGVELREHATNHRWVVGIVRRALTRAQESLGWHEPDLERFVEELAQRPLPLVHEFERFARTDAKSGLRCVPWISMEPNRTRIGVSIGTRDVALRESARPLFFEDDFPIARGAIVKGQFVLVGKSRERLASVPIVEEARESPASEITVHAFGNVWTNCTPVTAADVAAAEAQLGPLPPSLRELFMTVAGGATERNFFFDGKHEVMLGDVLSPTPSRSGLLAMCERFRRAGLRRGLIPFALDMGNADPFCIDAQSGHVMIWNHDPSTETDLGVTLEEFLVQLSVPGAGFGSPPW
jgi:hypothetical protein